MSQGLSCTPGSHIWCVMVYAIPFAVQARMKVIGQFHASAALFRVNVM